MPLEAQSVVVLQYLQLLHETGRGRRELRQPRPHRTGRARASSRALWLADARAAGVPTDGDSLLIGDTLVTICPWWDGPIGREALEPSWRRTTPRAAGPVGVGVPLAAARARRRAGPAAATTATPTSSAGSTSFRPDVVLTGHVHEPPFKPDGGWADRIGDTWVFNAGRQIGPVPAHIEIDLDAGTARGGRCSARSRLRLDRPDRRRRGTVF